MKISGRYLLILIGMCGLLATGVGLCTNVAGLFFTPIAEDFGVLRGSVSMTLTICNLVFAAGGMFTPRLVHENNFRFLLILGTAMIAGATMAMSLAQGMALLYVLNAVRGFAAGVLGFVFVTTIINRWFIDYNGLATSIAMCTSGLAGAVFSPVISSLIQNSGWRFAYVAVGILMVLFNLPAILFLPCLSPRSKGLSPLGTPKEAEVSHAGEAKSASVINKGILALAILFAVFSAGSTALPQFFPGLADSYTLPAAVGASMLSFCMIANTAGKLILGVIIDKIGCRLATIFYLALALIALVLFLMIHQSGALLAGAVLFGTVYALGTVSLAIMTRELFGAENYSRTYPTVSLAGTVANALLSTVVGFMYDFTGGYTAILIMFVIMLAAAVFIVLRAYAGRQVSV